MRIRAAGLTEALRLKEVSLEHVAGTELVADGMTKQLTGQPLLNFKKALGLRESEEGTKNIEVKKMDISGSPPDPRFLKVIGLMIVVASMVTRAEASETVKELPSWATSSSGSGQREYRGGSSRRS